MLLVGASQGNSWRDAILTPNCVEQTRAALSRRRTDPLLFSGATDCMNCLQGSVLRFFFARVSCRWEAVLLPRFREWGPGRDRPVCRRATCSTKVLQPAAQTSCRLTPMIIYGVVRIKPLIGDAVVKAPRLRRPWCEFSATSRVGQQFNTK